MPSNLVSAILAPGQGQVPDSQGTESAEHGLQGGKWAQTGQRERGAWEGRQQLRVGEGGGSWGEEGSPHERAIEKV